MNSTKRQIFAVGIVLGLLSLPMTWMTIPFAMIENPGGMGALINEAFEGTVTNVTALNARVNLIFDIPIWLPVGLAVTANALALLDSWLALRLRKLVLGTLAGVALALTTLAIGMIWYDDTANLAIGCWLGWFGAAAPLGGLLTPDE